MRVPRLLFVFDSNLRRLGTIIGVRNFPEPWMIKSLLRSDALRRIINEDLGKQIQEVLEEGVVRRDDVLHRSSANGWVPTSML
jgi:hypothetical protein